MNSVVPLGMCATGMISPLFLIPFYASQAKYIQSVFEFKQNGGSATSAKKLKRKSYTPFLVLLGGFVSTTVYKRYQKRRQMEKENAELNVVV